MLTPFNRGPAGSACASLVNNTCQVATDLVGHPVHCHPSSCSACTALPNPQTVNSMTVSLAAGSLYRANQPAAAQALLAKHPEHVTVHRNPAGHSESVNAKRLAAIESGTGPGSELWRLLESLGIQHTATCKCLSLAERMNDWGPVGCRAARADIVDQMRINAQQYGWAAVAKAATAALVSGLAWRLDPTDVYGSLVDESIRRAQAASSHTSPASHSSHAHPLPLPPTATPVA